MKLQPYVEKLNSSKQYQSFIEQNPQAFIVAGFFVLDFETGNNLHQIDYFIPSSKKVAAFTLDEEITIQTLELMGKKSPEKLDIKTNIDLDELKGILEDEMKNRNISEEIKKIIAVLQTIEGEKIWNLNCVLTGMEILKAHVEDNSKTVLKMEKASIIDFMKHIPASKLQSMQQPQKPASKEDAKSQLNKLEEIEQAIEKEKEELQKQAEKLEE